MIIGSGSDEARTLRRRAALTMLMTAARADDPKQGDSNMIAPDVKERMEYLCGEKGTRLRIDANGFSAVLDDGSLALGPDATSKEMAAFLSAVDPSIVDAVRGAG
jgi:hypothetical protein